MSADWAQIPGSVEPLGEMYGAASPPLESCGLDYVHIDERGDSVTLGFTTRSLPENPPAEWTAKEYNAVEICLVLDGVAGLRVNGWGAREAGRVSVRENGRNLDIVLGDGEAGVSFQARGVRRARLRPFLAAPD